MLRQRKRQALFDGDLESLLLRAAVLAICVDAAVNVLEPAHLLMVPHETKGDCGSTKT